MADDWPLCEFAACERSDAVRVVIAHSLDTMSDLVLLRDKVDGQELLPIKLAGQKDAHQAATEILRVSVLSLQDDLMRLMDIVELQMQIPVRIPVRIPPPLISNSMGLMRQGVLSAQQDTAIACLAMTWSGKSHTHQLTRTLPIRRF